MVCLFGMNPLRMSLMTSSLRARPFHNMVCSSYSAFSGHTSQANGQRCRGHLLRIGETIGVLHEKHHNRATANHSLLSCRSYRYVPTRGPDFKEIYRFKHITFTRLLSSLKIYQTAFTVLVCQYCLYLFSNGQVSASVCAGTIGAASFACVMLYIMSGFFRKIACIIYLNEKTDTIEISHLSFWGNRKDVQIKVSELLLLSDTSSESPNRVFVKLNTFSGQEPFYLFLHHGKISDETALKNLLGI